jgi:enoyl-CoA hydratase/carnithine racemase
VTELHEARDDRGVVTLTLNRPDTLNALTASMVSSLHAALRRLADDDSCRVVVLTGAGRGFCAGLDLGGYGDLTPVEQAGPVHRALEVQRHIVGLTQQIRRMPQTVVAAVNGAAAGGGLALVLASDVRLASTAAVFAVSFIRVGFSACDIGTSWMLPRIVGAGRAHELMLTGRRFDAQEALRIGLLADAVPAEQLLDRVEATVTALLAAAPLSLRLTKQGMWMALEIPSFDAAVEFENRQQVMTALTSDQGEAMSAFKERRVPKYTNA